jgi:hypothetical protein
MKLKTKTAAIVPPFLFDLQRIQRADLTGLQSEQGGKSI